jgi:hypothetical protein
MEGSDHVEDIESSEIHTDEETKEIAVEEPYPQASIKLPTSPNLGVTDSEQSDRPIEIIEAGNASSLDAI